MPMATTTTEDFGPSRPRDRRSELRHRFQPELACLVIPTAGPGLRAAAVRDISARGIGLFLWHAPRPGEPFAVELQEGPPAVRRRLQVVVRHATAEAGGGHVVGAEFLSPLSHEDLHSLGA